MSKVVLVLGASGLFGSHAARAFRVAGWEVRRYRRGTDMIAAAKGADVIVNGLNPPAYHAWAKLVPRITRQAITAAEASGATLIVPANVYVYGTQPGPWGPDTPQVPVSRKGAIRVAAEAEYRAASARGVQVILLRGGDFVAPDAPNSFWNMVTLKNLSRGKITTMAAPEVKRAYAYLPDMARIAVALAEKRDELPAFTDLPFAGFTLSMAEMKTEMEHLTWRALRLSRFPWWLMTLASPFWELARELREMRYLYDLPHELDNRPLEKLLPDFHATPMRAVLAAHLPEAQGRASLIQTGR